jgi:succinate dehydrogenase/fumarate reductase flavoprotein subunit
LFQRLAIPSAAAHRGVQAETLHADAQRLVELRLPGHRALQRQQLLAGTRTDGDRAFHMAWHDWINLKNLLATPRVIATAALAREDSRGVDFRENHPHAGDLPGTTCTVVAQPGRPESGACRHDTT